MILREDRLQITAASSILGWSLYERPLECGASPLAFGGFHTIELVCEPGPHGVRLFVDEQTAGMRKRDPGTLRLDALFIAARCYSNSPEPPAMGSFFSRP